MSNSNVSFIFNFGRAFMRTVNEKNIIKRENWEIIFQKTRPVISVAVVESVFSRINKFQGALAVLTGAGDRNSNPGSYSQNKFVNQNG